MIGVSSYTLVDFAGSMLGVVAFSLVLGLPGYGIGWVLDVAGFRERSIADRLAWAVLLSLSCVTYLSVVVSKYASLRVTCLVVVALSATGLLLLARDVAGAVRRRTGADLRPGLWIAGGLLLWSLFVVAQLIDIGWGGKLYMSATVIDHAVRNAFVEAVVRTGVPPHNPLYWTVSGTGASAVGHAAPMRYYYFWYVLCGLVVKLAGVSSRQAFIASCVWSSIALVCLIRLYSRHFLGGDERTIRRRAWVGIALLGVTGLDLLPVSYDYLHSHVLGPDMEWWSVTQISSWIDTVLWVPHHLAALVCCLLGFLLIWMAAEMRRPKRWICGVIAGAGFASSFGLSTYVSAAFAMVLMAWFCWYGAGKRRNWKRLSMLLGAGGLAVVLLLPYVLELRADGSNATDGSGKTHVLAVGIRRMIPEGMVNHHEAFRRIELKNPRVIDRAVALALLLPGYFVELGVYTLVLGLFLWRAWRRNDLSDPQAHALFLSVSGLVVCTFVKSDVITTNDFGIRASLIPQFFLLLLAVSLGRQMLMGVPKVVRGFAWAMVLLGVLGSVYQILLLRLYYPVEEAKGRQGLEGLAAETMALRQAGTALAALTPRDAVVQFNLDQLEAAFMFAHVLNTPRQMVNSDFGCVYAFGGDASACPEILESLGRLYLNPAYGGRDESYKDADSVYGVCERLQIDYLVVTPWDRVWNEPHAWPWTLPELVAEPNVRVLGCRHPQTN